MLQMLTDKNATEEYVRDLFRYVLDRKTVSDQEVACWTKELFAGRSPIEVFRLFALSPENSSRRAHVTQYPNGHFYSPVVHVGEIEMIGKGYFVGARRGVST